MYVVHGLLKDRGPGHRVPQRRVQGWAENCADRHMYAAGLLENAMDCGNIAPGIAHEVFARRPPQRLRRQSGPLSFLASTVLFLYELEATVL